MSLERWVRNPEEFNDEENEPTETEPAISNSPRAGVSQGTRTIGGGRAVFNKPYVRRAAMVVLAMALCSCLAARVWGSVEAPSSGRGEASSAVEEDVMPYHFDKVSSMKDGKVSHCKPLGCWVPDWSYGMSAEAGLQACKVECRKTDGCNGFNFRLRTDIYDKLRFPHHGCCMHSCERDDLDLVESNEEWDVYKKSGGCWVRSGESHENQCTWAKECVKQRGETWCEPKFMPEAGVIVPKEVAPYGTAIVMNAQ